MTRLLTWLRARFPRTSVRTRALAAAGDLPASWTPHRTALRDHNRTIRTIR